MPNIRTCNNRVCSRRDKDLRWRQYRRRLLTMRPLFPGVRFIFTSIELAEQFDVDLFRLMSSGQSIESALP